MNPQILLYELTRAIGVGNLPRTAEHLQGLTEMGQEKAAVGLLENPNLQNQAEKETKEVRKVENERKRRRGRLLI